MKNSAPAMPVPGDRPAGYVSMARPVAPGHHWTYTGLWLFTLFLIFRPSDLHPALARTAGASFIIAALTLVAFVIRQLWMEGRLSAVPLEVGIVIALAAGAALSIFTGVNRGTSMAEFMDVFIKAILMFIVMVNVVRTEQRLQRLLWLTLFAGVYVSFNALNAYRTGQFSAEGYRVSGALGAALHDPNDTALFLVTMVPIAVAFMLTSRKLAFQILYGLGALLMTAAIVVTYSRGGFLALAGAGGLMCWRLFRRAPVPTALFVLTSLFVVFFVLPGNYAGRLASILDPDLDTRGSASARKNLLERSIRITSEHPIFGVGMGNFPEYSISDKKPGPTFTIGQVSHNAYTQVSSEMGIPVLLIYVSFMIAALVRLRRVERETDPVADSVEVYGRIHYMAMGLQASILGFMIGSFFLSVAYYWFIYYLVGYAVSLGRIYETNPGRIVGAYSLGAQPGT